MFFNRPEVIDPEIQSFYFYSKNKSDINISEKCTNFSSLKKQKSHNSSKKTFRLLLLSCFMLFISTLAFNHYLKPDSDRALIFEQSHVKVTFSAIVSKNNHEVMLNILFKNLKPEQTQTFHLQNISYDLFHKDQAFLKESVLLIQKPLLLSLKNKHIKYFSYKIPLGDKTYLGDQTLKIKIKIDNKVKLLSIPFREKF